MFCIIRYMRKMTFNYESLSFYDKDKDIQIIIEEDYIESDSGVDIKRVELSIKESGKNILHLFSRPSRITAFLRGEGVRVKETITQYFDKEDILNQDDLEYALINGRKLLDNNLLRYSKHKDYIIDFFKNKE